MDAAEALRRVRASWVVPVHYGTFWPVGMGRVRRHMFHGPGEEFAQHAARTAPDSQVRVLNLGETLTVRPSSAAPDPALAGDDA